MIQLAPPLTCGPEEFDVHHLRPARRPDRGVEADLTPPSGERYRRLSLWWDGLPGRPRGPARRSPATLEVDVAIVGGGLHRAVDRLLPGRGRPRPADRRPRARRGRLRRLGPQRRLVLGPVRRVRGRRSTGSAGPGSGAAHAPGHGGDGRRGGPGGGGRGHRLRLPPGRHRGAGPHARPSWHRTRRRGRPRPGPRGIGEDDLRLLSAAEAPRPGRAPPTCSGGTYTPHCAAVDPARLVRGLAEAVERRGVTHLRADRGRWPSAPGVVDHRPGHGAGRHRGPGHRGLHPHPAPATSATWSRSTR